MILTGDDILVVVTILTPIYYQLHNLTLKLNDLEIKCLKHKGEKI